GRGRSTLGISWQGWRAVMNRRRVVITGMGAVTPLGHSVDALFGGACAGRSAVRPIQSFDARTFPTTFAAEVLDFNLAQFLPGAERWADCGVNCRFALAAAKQALEDANLLNAAGIDRTRVGIYLGCGEGSHDFPNLMSAIAHSSDGRRVDSAAFFREGLAHFH